MSGHPSDTRESNRDLGPNKGILSKSASMTQFHFADPTRPNFYKVDEDELPEHHKIALSDIGEFAPRCTSVHPRSGACPRPAAKIDGKFGLECQPCLDGYKELPDPSQMFWNWESAKGATRPSKRNVFERDQKGRIIRNERGMPRQKTVEEWPDLDAQLATDRLQAKGKRPSNWRAFNWMTGRKEKFAPLSDKPHTVVRLKGTKPGEKAYKLEAFDWGPYNEEQSKVEKYNSEHPEEDLSSFEGRWDPYKNIEPLPKSEEGWTNVVLDQIDYSQVQKKHKFTLGGPPKSRKPSVRNFTQPGSSGGNTGRGRPSSFGRGLIPKGNAKTPDESPASGEQPPSIFNEEEEYPSE